MPTRTEQSLAVCAVRFTRDGTSTGIFGNSLAGAQRGITLVELLVVVTLLAVLAAVALPNLERLTASMTRDTQLEHIKNQIATLGATAMLDGRDYIVLGTDPEAATDLAAHLVGRTPYPLDVPDGWVVVIEEPILVRASGVCLGGRVTLTHEELEPVHVDLEAPFCRVDAS
ncbi:MAG: prepilin-type N-terminal cleavage/methylation domain-containing protein [Gammaproteobacteria bacterium]|nr:prepilin-type N-terminal cleavage/methylation domain-containing protein [Gammaproteobacteria bacterium]